VEPVELMIQLALESDMRQLFWQTFSPFDYDRTLRCLRHPNTVVGFSDSGAHVSQMSDASIETHLLAHFVRDRQDFTLEEAVRMLTLEPARMFGFADRGLLREGLVADINVFDPTTVGPAMPELVYELPSGARRLSQTAVGITFTLVAGEGVIADGRRRMRGRSAGAVHSRARASVIGNLSGQTSVVAPRVAGLRGVSMAAPPEDPLGEAAGSSRPSRGHAP
jgi:N-acyl-D-aspartate/D-glutamate deacylase